MKGRQTIPKNRRERSQSKKEHIGMDGREHRVLLKPPLSIGDGHRSGATSSTAVALDGGDVDVDGVDGDNENRVGYSGITDGKDRRRDNFERVHTHCVTKLLYRVVVEVNQILVKFHRLSPLNKLAFYVIMAVSICAVLRTARNLARRIHIRIEDQVYFGFDGKFESFSSSTTKAAGGGNNVIAYSLYGDNPKYGKGMIANADLVQNVYVSYWRI